MSRELLVAKEAAVHDAMHDPLTGLPNRTFFVSRLERALGGCRAGTGSNFSVMFIDLDRFKIVNDSLGHVAGDGLIVEVGERLRGLVARPAPSSDGSPATAGDFLARLGGDEFIVFMADDDRGTAALSLAARIQDVLAEAFEIKGEAVHTSASIGIASNGARYGDPIEVLRDADLAMYRAKHLGKAHAELYDASLHSEATARMHIETNLRRAIANEEFVLHYQPIVALGSQRIVGFEALVRWRTPDGALLYPGDFIPVSEETGLIVPMGLWVLREACRSARAWGGIAGAGDRPTMSVNLSPRQFAQRDLVRRVGEILEETGVDPALIKLEITEGSTMDDPERAVRILMDLKALGVQLSVDDFGTGYSSLSYLQRFPVDVLKIDRSFVTGMMESVENRQLVMTILALAQGMGMKVVAEGIETAEQAAELHHLACDFGQGYFFARPLPQGEAETLLQLSCLKAIQDERRGSEPADADALAGPGAARTA